MGLVGREQEKALLREHGYRWRKENGIWQLYDPRGEGVSKEQALDDIEQGQVPEPVKILCLEDRPAAQVWARGMLHEEPLFLDTETTGTGEDAHVIDIALVGLSGIVEMDTLVMPPVPIPDHSSAIHSITDEMVQDAPTLQDIWEDLRWYLEEWPLVIYNAAFDTRIIRQSANYYGLQVPAMQTHCLMKQYAVYAGVVRPGGDGYTNQKLSEACRCFGIEEGTHRALADAQAARCVLLAMAK